MNTPTTTKAFVLDTSVLIHDPESLLHFGEHDVFIPLEVINELDRIKTESTERGQAARSVQRKLLTYLPEGARQGSLPTGGAVEILMPNGQAEKESAHITELLGELTTPDHRIILAATCLKASSGRRVTLVSKDMGMALKARAVELETEDYRFDKSREKEDGTLEIEIADTEMAKFSSSGMIELPEERIPSELEVNAYGLFAANKKMPWRHTGFGRFVPIYHEPIQVPGGAEIRARNLEQAFLIDALLDPAITLVTAAGRAGTGKTIVTVAASLEMIGRRGYTGVCIAKPIEAVGKESGFLPGTLEEKMRPWLQPYADAINYLHRGQGQNKRQSGRKQKNTPPGAVKSPYDRLTESGVMEITAIEHIRGRSIPNRLFIVDEVQNISPKIAKTIASRLAEGSKLILLGDLDQIDNPYLDKFSNGLSHIRAKMRNLANVAHVTLKKGERSLLAEQAAKLL